MNRSVIAGRQILEQELEQIMSRFPTPRRQIQRRLGCGMPKRTAAAVVECAILLPIVVVLVFGAIEIANGIFLKQALAVAAYEGARAASKSTGTLAQVESRIQEVLDSRGIDNETISVTPNLTTAERGTKITVTVSAPSSEMGSVGPLQYLQSKSFSRSVVMVRL